MSNYFIDRPIFAWVIAMILMLAGVLSISHLPVSRYPRIAPPAVLISATYPGASAQTGQDSVTQIIEQNMLGLDGLLYMTSTSDSAGYISITLTFASGTNPDIAQVQVQNKLQVAEPLLPQIVQQQGITVTKTNTNFMMAIGFTSDSPDLSAADVDDYLATNLQDPLSRIEGVGSVQVFGSGKYAMRIWLDPGKLATYGLMPDDIVNAVKAQNAQVSIGQLGGMPFVPGQQLNATVSALGRLSTPDQFRNIVIRANTDGSTLRLGDVARVELGATQYVTQVFSNGKVSSGMGVTLASGANALTTSAAVIDTLHRLEPNFPAGMHFLVAYDTTPFVRKSIVEVMKTLGEAIVLVFLVMWLFLQNLRATLIPTIAVPVVLLGTFTVLDLAGFSINMLTMFAVVLAIGLLVDDAIVVVENVERLMTDEGISPLEATRRSMKQITGALVGIATVLSAVFVPMAFLNGSSGVIYRQFSLTIVTAMVLSVIVAIVVTPALCATLLKPVAKGQHHSNRGFFGWFNRFFDRTNLKYQGAVSRILARTGRFLLIYVGLASLMGLLFIRLPTAYVPEEDQGYLFLLMQTPVGSTLTRAVNALDKIKDYFLTHEKEATQGVFLVAGYSPGGTGQNSAFGYITLKDWDERRSKDLTAAAMQPRAARAAAAITDAQAFIFAPPAIAELGSSAGFDFYLKDNSGKGHQALIAARNQLLAAAHQDKQLALVRPAGVEDAPQFRLDINAQKLTSLGLTTADVNDTLQIGWGGRYIDDFLDRGRVKRVIMQGDAPFRMRPEDINDWYVRNKAGAMVPVASFAGSHWEYGPPRLERFNGVAAVEINGQAAPGVSSGQAMKEIERLVAQLPPGYSVDWAGESYQERAAGAQIPQLYTLSIIVVFLCLAALYESWSIPTAILLAVPLGVIGAVIATAVRGLERDIYFQVAMLTTIGLTSKNAILIVEFAKEYVEGGMNLIEGTLHAVRDRLRPILMTSLAFGLGVLPLCAATGAGAGAQRAIGTGVFGGMLGGTFLGIFFTPLFFVVVQHVFHGVHERAEPPTALDAAVGTGNDVTPGTAH
jgi:multidrug efflux pump